MSLSTIYERRFVELTGLEKRSRVWQTLCTVFFNPLLGTNNDVLDLGCGYGEFINNVSARRKTAVDLNPNARHHLSSDVRFIQCSSLRLEIDDASQDIVFASNFLEHLRDKAELETLFSEVYRVLRHGGLFIILGPNIKYAYRDYWDYFDHYIPLSHLSLAEGLEINGFKVVRNIPRFLPFTMAGSIPTANWMIRLYLRLPFVWRILGKQFLIVAKKINRPLAAGDGPAWLAQESSSLLYRRSQGQLKDRKFEFIVAHDMLDKGGGWLLQLFTIPWSRAAKFCFTRASMECNPQTTSGRTTTHAVC